MNKLDKEKKLIEYMQGVINHFSKKHQITEIHSLDIRNPSKNSEEFSFEKDLIHELVFKSEDESLYHVLINDPYEPLYEKSIISLERVKDLNSFHVRISYFVEKKKLKILDDDL